MFVQKKSVHQPNTIKKAYVYYNARDKFDGSKKRSRECLGKFENEQTYLKSQVHH